MARLRLEDECMLTVNSFININDKRNVGNALSHLDVDVLEIQVEWPCAIRRIDGQYILRIRRQRNEVRMRRWSRSGTERQRRTMRRGGMALERHRVHRIEAARTDL